MSIVSIFSYLVPPGHRSDEDTLPHGTNVPLSGGLFTMLAKLYGGAPTECKIPIRFRCDDGTQQNSSRDELLRFLTKPSLATGGPIALRLSHASTFKSGLGLLFLITGKEGRERRLLVSRFPAHEGVVAEAKTTTLHLDFVEKVFMRSATTYKAALYSGTSLVEDFWDGMVVDRQLAGAASYWIKDFLLSDYRTTSAAGSRRLGKAFREATKAAEGLLIKQQLINATGLIPGLHEQPISVRSLFDRYQFSDETQEAITDHLPNAHLVDDVFALDRDEFNREAALHVVELDTGAVLMAPTDRFTEIFTQEPLGITDTVRFSAQGRITNETLTKARKP